MDQNVSGGLLVSGILFLFYLVPSIVVFGKLYKRAGHPFWPAIVPVYNYIVMARIAQKPAWLGWVVGLLSLGANLNPNAGPDQPPIFTIATLFWIVFGLYLLHSFIKRYDRGLGAWFIYIFIPLIGIFITDKANYKPLKKNRRSK